MSRGRRICCSACPLVFECLDDFPSLVPSSAIATAYDEALHIEVDTRLYIELANGATATLAVIGIATLFKITTLRMQAFKAREEGKEFKEDEVTTCMTLYQISGTGAVVASK